MTADLAAARESKEHAQIRHESGPAVPIPRSGAGFAAPEPQETNPRDKSTGALRRDERIGTIALGDLAMLRDLLRTRRMDITPQAY